MALKTLSILVLFASILLSGNGLLELLLTCSTKDFKRDEASVTFVNNIKKSVNIFTKSQECWECSLTKMKTIPAHVNFTLNFSTNFGVDLFIETKDNVYLCNISLKMQEGNKYVIDIKPDSCDQTSFCNDLPDPNIPIYLLVGAMFLLIILWKLSSNLKKPLLKRIFAHFKRLKLKFLKRSDSDDSDADSQESTSELIEADLGRVEKGGRLQSVDAFRGFSLLLMIFVNYGGGGYWYFHHAPWDGCTLADLVFPWFVFIMGVTVAISFRSYRMRGVGRFRILGGVLRRSVLLFCLGLVVSNRNRSLYELRIPGVLQRLSLIFLVVGVVETFENPIAHGFSNKFLNQMRDIICYWRSWSVVIVCIAVHSCITFLLPVPDCPKGYLGAGGLHDNGLHENCTGGAAGYVDRIVLGSNHIYQNPTCKSIYKTHVPFDPEGLLGTLTSVVTCYLGVQAGRILLSYGKFGMVARWFVWASILGVSGGLLCGFRQFGGFIPLNKNLWSISFVFVLSSMAFILFIIFYFLIDLLKVWDGAPFIYPGMNSIVVYLCSEIFENHFPLHLFSPTTHFGLTFHHFWGVLFWIVVSVVLHWKKIYITL